MPVVARFRDVQSSGQQKVYECFRNVSQFNRSRSERHEILWNLYVDHSDWSPERRLLFEGRLSRAVCPTVPKLKRFRSHRLSHVLNECFVLHPGLRISRLRRLRAIVEVETEQNNQHKPGRLKKPTQQDIATTSTTFYHILKINSGDNKHCNGLRFAMQLHQETHLQTGHFTHFLPQSRRLHDVICILYPGHATSRPQKGLVSTPPGPK